MTVIDNHEAVGMEGVARLSEASARDYFELLKPRVMSLVVFTALAGLVLAPGHINPFIGFIAILCIAERRQATPAQVALAWAMQLGYAVIHLPPSVKTSPATCWPQNWC